MSTILPGPSPQYQRLGVGVPFEINLKCHRYSVSARFQHDRCRRPRHRYRQPIWSAGHDFVSRREALPCKLMVLRAIVDGCREVVSHGWITGNVVLNEEK